LIYISDLVSICTPPLCHAEAVVACLKAGINVLVEKPMAASLEECDAMLAAEEESGKVLASVAQNRFRDPIASLKKALDSGLAGGASSTRRWIPSGGGTSGKPKGAAVR
jgi:predicted dehydrogenase